MNNLHHTLWHRNSTPRYAPRDLFLNTHQETLYKNIQSNVVLGTKILEFLDYLSGLSINNTQNKWIEVYNGIQAKATHQHR